MKIKYGFEINSIKYGWHKKELYRLPFTSYKRNYGLKKINPFFIGATECYNICRKPKTINTLKILTTNVEWVVNVVNSEECPF